MKHLFAGMQLIYFLQLKQRMSKLNVIAPGGTSKRCPQSLSLLMNNRQDDIYLGEICDCFYHLAKCKSVSLLSRLRPDGM